MNDKIEVGEYVRTKKGDIDKIDGYIVESNIYHCENEMCIDTENRIGIRLEDIVKRSKDLIDLVEVGDYVNGEKIIEVRKQNDKTYLMTDYCPQKYIIKDEIKSIVTKEQFLSVEYKEV